MTSVIDIRKVPETLEFTRKVPEESTLLELAMDRPVKVFVVEHIDNGMQMCLAHFDHDGWHNLYQDGQGPSSHLFFWVAAWQDGRSPEDMALEFLGGNFILSD